ncbi:MAG: YitT family protein [Clostridia bacterium]|nr:YitT family protein [Clostridia bacterium]
MHKFFHGIKEVLILLFASVGYAVGIALFLEPKGLAAGGVSGLAIVLGYLTDLNTGFIIFIINVPLIVFGIYKFGLRFLLSTVFVIAVSSAVIDFCKRFPIPQLDTFCACVCGSVLIGGSIGVIFRMGATTGGSDIIVRLLRLKFRHIRSGGIFLALDIIVIALAGIVFRNIEICVYAGVCVVIEAYIINFILYGLSPFETVCVFSEKSDAFLKNINKSELQIRLLKANESGVFFLVAHKKDLPQLRLITAQSDETAVVVVCASKGIFGGEFSPLGADDE